MHPYGQSRNTSHRLDFQNGSNVITTKDGGRTNRFEEEIFVRAPEVVAHADTRTQMVRTEFMGLRKGETGVVIAMYENLYGRFITVEREDGGHVDCLPSQLVTIDKATYEFFKTPAKFLYRTNHVALSEFEYDRDVQVGHVFDVELAPNLSPMRLRVTEVMHVIRTVSAQKHVPIRIHLTVEQF